MKLPEGLTQKQLDLLVKITPGPIGEGKTIVQAAEELGISERAAQYRLDRFKQKLPEAYENWDNIMKLSQSHRKILDAVFVSTRYLDRFKKTDPLSPDYVECDCYYLRKYSDSVKINFEEYERDFSKKGKSYYKTNKIKEKF